MNGKRSRGNVPAEGEAYRRVGVGRIGVEAKVSFFVLVIVDRG